MGNHRRAAGHGRCSPWAARKGKGGVGDSPRGSPELGERRSGRVTRVKWRRWWSSTGACSDVGEEERGAVSGAGCSGWRCPFIGAGGGRGVTILADIVGETSGVVNGNLSALKL
jgi:hypothetical protein